MSHCLYFIHTIEVIEHRNVLITNIIQNIYFMFNRRNELGTSEQHENE